MPDRIQRWSGVRDPPHHPMSLEDHTGNSPMRDLLADPGSNDDHRQDSKGTWWMPWHLEPMKDVNDCDKPR